MKIILLENSIFTWVVVVHAFSSSTWEAEADGALCVQGHTGLQSCTEKPCPEKF